MENHTQNGISKLSEWNGEWKKENKKIKKLNADNENDDDDDFFWEMRLKQPTTVRTIKYVLCVGSSISV